MPRMPTFEEIRADFEREAAAAGRLFRHHQTPAAPPAGQAAQAAPNPHQEDNMSLLDTIKNGIAEAEAKLEGIAEEDLALLKRVQANPETSVILKDLDSLAGVIGIPQGFITGTANGLKVLLAAYASEQAPADPQRPAVPAGQ